MSWNKHDAVSYARSHAHQKSQGYCARAVAAAIRAGGVKIEGATPTIFQDHWKKQDSANHTEPQ